MRKSLYFILSCFLSLFVSTAQATSFGEQVLIASGSEWQYSIKPGALFDANHDLVNWDNIAWKTAKAGFSDSLTPHTYPYYPRPANKLWPVNTSLILQKTISYDAQSGKVGGDYDVTSLNISGFVDNWLAIFINGQKIEGFTKPANSFIYNMTISEQVLSGIWNQQGDNLIQIIALDWGGRTYFDMQMTANTTPPAATPIPGAVWLLGSGIAGVISLRRRMPKVE